MAPLCRYAGERCTAPSCFRDASKRHSSHDPGENDRGSSPGFLGKGSADLAKDLRRAIRQAGVLGLPIGEETTRDRSRSDLERDFLRICRRYHLPVPEVNVRVGRHLVDFLWRDRMLVVETDGYIYHRGRAAFEDDRIRGLALRGLGYEVLRIADRQIDDEPAQIAGILRGRLGNGSEARHDAP